MLAQGQRALAPATPPLQILVLRLTRLDARPQGLVTDLEELQLDFGSFARARLDPAARSRPAQGDAAAAWVGRCAAWDFSSVSGVGACRDGGARDLPDREHSQPSLGSCARSKHHRRTEPITAKSPASTCESEAQRAARARNSVRPIPPQHKRDSESARARRHLTPALSSVYPIEPRRPRTAGLSPLASEAGTNPAAHPGPACA